MFCEGVLFEILAAREVVVAGVFAQTLVGEDVLSSRMDWGKIRGGVSLPHADHVRSFPLC